MAHPAWADSVDSMVAREPELQANAARAQVRTLRESDPYAPLGLRAGTFEFRPSLEIAAVGSTNPGQASGEARPAAGVRLAPELEIKSAWPRHSFWLKASGERIDYADGPELTALEGTLDSRLMLDIRRNTTAELLMSAAQWQSTPASSEVPDDAAGKRTDDEITLGAGVSRTGSWLEGRLRTALSRLVYGDVELSDGSTEDNGDRNYVEASAAARLTAGSSAEIRPLVELAISQRLHDEKLDRNGVERNSLGIAVRAGAEFAADGLWSGAAGLEYDFRHFTESEFADYSAIGVFAEMEWRPSAVTRVTLTAETGFEESATAGVSGYRTQEAEIDLVHAFRENITLTLSASLDYSAAQGASSSKSLAMEAGGEIAYALNRALSLTASYGHMRYIALAEEGDYAETEITAGMRISR
jgi:hypothetical protein